MALVIRPEKPGEESTIHDLTQKAFAPKAFSDGTEGAIIDKLRANGDLTLSLIALKDDQIVGHVAFSPVKISHATGDWYGLGPVAVTPDLQKTGIGTKIITKGLETIREMGAEGCALTGDPGYYNRFGFRATGTLHYAGTDDKYVQWFSFTDQPASGELTFSTAFEG